MRRVNPDYRSPADLLSRWSDPPVLPVECSAPTAAGHEHHGPSAGDEYLLAVDEVLANALVHGGPPVALRLWVRHSEVVTTVTDPGGGFADAFIGYATRSASVTDGRAPRRQMGLWLARQMCDELSFRHDEEGFTVRLRAELDVCLDD